MVNLVNPLFRPPRVLGGPQPGAPLGEGFTSGEPSLLEAVTRSGDGGPAGNGLLGGGQGTSGQLGGGMFGGGGGVNPLLMIGAALQGNNPLEVFQAGIRAQQAQRQRQFENQLKLRLFQRQEAEFRQQQRKQAQVGSLLTQFAEEAEAAGDSNARGFRLAAANLNPRAAQALLASKESKAKTLTDEELEEVGLPPDTVAVWDKDGNPKIIFNTSVDSFEARRRLRRAGTSASGAALEKEQRKLERKDQNVFDTETGRNARVSQNDIDAEPDRFVPTTSSVRPEGQPEGSSAVRDRLLAKVGRGEELTKEDRAQLDLLQQLDPLQILTRKALEQSGTSSVPTTPAVPGALDAARAEIARIEADPNRSPEQKARARRAIEDAFKRRGGDPGAL